MLGQRPCAAARLLIVGLLLPGGLSCGGGGSHGGGTLAGGGIIGTGSATGAITGFGSVIVNGVRFGTAGSAITLDGAAGAEGDLDVGMVVRVDGTVNADGTGAATRIEFEDLLEGPVDSVNATAGTFAALGQTVSTDDSTVFDGTSLAALAAGQVVEVSGLVDAAGSLRATRVELKQAAVPGVTELELKGVVGNFNAGNATFRLQNLTVNFSGAQLLNAPPGGLADGLTVEVMSRTPPANGTLNALQVEVETPDPAPSAGTWLEIEGFVTRFASGVDFDVDGQAARTDAQTRFDRGTAADLAQNAKVEVEGTVGSDGILAAGKVSFRREPDIRIEADVQAVDAAGGTLALLGVAVAIDAQTQIEDGSSAALRPFSLAGVNAGDRVEVRAYRDPATGAVIAARVERRDPAPGVVVRGPVDSVSAPSVVILGLTVQTGGATAYEDDNDNPISGATFFGAVQAGTVVEASGALQSGNTILASEMELE